MPFDPDFEKSGFARHLFRLRFRGLKLSQRDFAERFGLSYSVVRDAEQGAKPSRTLRLVVAAIACDPAFVEAVARQDKQPCTCGESDPYRCCTTPPVTGARQLKHPSARARARCHGKGLQNGQA